MTLRGRLVALALVVAALFALGILVLLRSRTSDCGLAAPRPSLGPALRALGDFDQAYDSTNTAALEDAAVRAASALHPGLIGATAESPVAEASGIPSNPSALVVPLRAHVAAEARPALAGLVVFLLDCQGNAYFANVEDTSSVQPPLAEYPPVSRAQAERSLGSTGLRLQYLRSPLTPQWVTIGGPPRSLSAR